MKKGLVKRPLSLLYDATSLGKRMSGLERYTEELLKAIIPKIREKGLTLSVLFSSNEIARKFVTQEMEGEGIVPFFPKHPFSSRLIKDHLWIPKMIRRLAPRVAFFPAFPPSPFVFWGSNGTLFWRTIHDAVSWKHTETLSWKNSVYFLPLETFAIKRYNLIVTVSQFSLSELRSVFPKESDHMVDFGNSVSALPAISSGISLERERLRDKWPLPDRYILCVGTLEPRKNFPFIIEMMGSLRRLVPDVGLVIAGRDGWGAGAVREALRKAGPASGILLTGAISDSELQALYSGASLVAFPSLYEGFGYPVLEAMQWGCPVIANRIPVMEEVVGEGGILVPVSDQSGWIDAMARVLEDSGERERLLPKMRSNLDRYRWDLVADRFLEKLEKVQSLPR